jgi:hypothetical protein
MLEKDAKQCHRQVILNATSPDVFRTLGEGTQSAGLPRAITLVGNLLGRLGE